MATCRVLLCLSAVKAARAANRTVRAQPAIGLPS